LKRTRYSISLAVLALLVSGCGSTAANVSAPPATSPNSPASPVSAGAAATPIKIGVLEPTTGTSAELGKDNEEGLRLFLSSVDDTVAGRKIEAVFADDQGKPDVALTKAKALVENDHVQVLMGMNHTPVCYAVAQYVKQAQVPLLVTGNCSAQNLTTSPQFASPYLARFTQTSSGMADPLADWASKQGYHKAVLITSDYGGGLEEGDAFASAFIERGGTIVQELHPAQGTADFGPFLAQLDRTADVVTTFLPGTDGLHFGEQYGDYATQHKPQMLDITGVMTKGPSLVQLKQKAEGIVATNTYSQAFDSPMNRAYIARLHTKYPDRFPSADIAAGYSAGQILAAALERVSGRIEDKQQFLDALYATDMPTVRGPIRLDDHHDVVEDVYVYRIISNGGPMLQKLEQTYKGVTQFWDLTPSQTARLQIGQMKGKWSGMTKTQLDQLMGQ